MTPLEHAISQPNYRPLTGQCIIQFDETPSMVGLIHIPDAARDPSLLNRDQMTTGTVLYMTPRDGGEAFSVGDRVAFLLRASDLGQNVVSTHNTRIYAVVGHDARVEKISRGLPV